MTKSKVDDAQVKGSNLGKDPDDWTTGDEPMTAAQASYLKTLSEEAGEAFDGKLSKADAAKRIEALQKKRAEVSDVECLGRVSRAALCFESPPC